MIHVPSGSQRCARHLRQATGFTLVELMTVVAIIGLLAGLAIPNYLEYVEKARVVRAIVEIRSIATAIDAFYVTSDRYPTSLAEVGAATMIDPWGNPYEYFNIVAWASGGNGNGNGGAGGAGGSGSGSGGTGGGTGSGSGTGGGTGGSSSGGGSGGGGGKDGKGGGTSWEWLGPSVAFAASSRAPQMPRKDRFLHPINSDYDLYSRGKDGESVEPLTAQKSHDDVIRANDGAFIGLAKFF